ncbi:MAG: LysM peptidoglycan-binding domain-containing protein, partial [Anaerolineae bacterium]
MNENMGSNEERGVGHRWQSYNNTAPKTEDAEAANKQLLTGLLVTLVSVGMLLGGFLLSQLDRAGQAAWPTQAIARVSTLTPFLPTLTPRPSATRPGAETPPPPTLEEEPSITTMPEGETAVAATPERGLTVAATPEVALVIPVKLRLAPTQTSTPPLLCTRPPGWIIYTVRRGDTLATLAARAGTTTLDLMQANCLSTSALVAGQRIYLPAEFYARPTPKPTPCGPPSHWVVY